MDLAQHLRAREGSGPQQGLPYDARRLHHVRFQRARFLPHTDEEQVVSCGAEGKIIVTHVPSVGHDSRAQVRHLFTCHNNIVNRIVIDPNGSNVFYSCGDDGTVRRFDRRAKHECRDAGEPCEDNVFINLTDGDKFTSRSVGLNALTIDPSAGLHIATAGSDPFVRLYDVRNPSEPLRVYRPSWQSEVVRRDMHLVRSLYTPYPHLTSLAFDRTGTELLASYGGDYIYLLSTIGGGEGATVADEMEVERPRASVSPAIQRALSRDAGEGGDETSGQPASAQWDRKRGRSESDSSLMSEEKDEDEEAKEASEVEDEHSESEENEEEENEIEDAAEDDDDDDDEDEDDSHDDESFDDDNPWDLDDADEFVEDPRIRNPEVSVDFIRQWRGHLNVRTIKEVNFFGPDDQYILSGSDDGHIFVWEKQTGKLVQLLKGDATIVNCIQGHPLDYPILAASGLDHDVKVFMPTAKSACCLDHAQRVMDKNTNTLEYGRSLAGQIGQRLSAIFRNEGEEGDEDCTLS